MAYNIPKMGFKYPNWVYLLLKLMTEDGKKLLNLMFLPDETVCVSNSKISYHSIPLDNAMDGEVTLLPPLKPDKTLEEQIVKCDSDELLLISLNPIEGYGRDSNVKKFRNFMVELDVGTIDEQLQYIKHSKIPYSAIVFSGSKSAHVLISLSDDIPDEKTYRMFAQWILNILPLADQNIKNPSRRIRIPGAQRSPGKFQQLLEFKGKVEPKELGDWLSKYPDSMPKPRKTQFRSNKENIDHIKPWTLSLMKRAKSGFPAGMGRNQGWFQIACDLYMSGFNEDRAIEILSAYFEEDHDFKEKEWISSIQKAFKHMSQK